MSGRSLAWINAMRWQYYPTTFLVLLVGVSVSVYEGLDSYVVVLWMVLGNFLLHCSCSLINEYTDFVTGADLVEYPEMGWKATGGSRVLVDQLIEPRNVLVISLLLFFGSVCIWVVLGAKLGYVHFFGGDFFIFGCSLKGRILLCEGDTAHVWRCSFTCSSCG
ncbi:MAG: hypothetical protein AYK19_12820 [Theionarchaea archaeon DG-70-1]|nr:MAG: hypothetical protein AYK19_12820 [Theionarchaea archaeon DG-70-1]